MIKFKKLLQNREGFTLIELLIVIVVLGILAAIAIPQITNFRDRARFSAAQADLRNLKTTLQMEYTMSGSYWSIIEDYYDEATGYRIINADELEPVFEAAGINYSSYDPDLNPHILGFSGGLDADGDIVGSSTDTVDTDGAIGEIAYDFTLIFRAGLDGSYINVNSDTGLTFELVTGD